MSRISEHARGAALVSRHAPTCRRVAQSLGAAGLQVHTTPFPFELPLPDLGQIAAVLLDLDVSPTDSPSVLVAEARRVYPDVPMLVVAGIDARARLLDALCELDVNHVMPKRGSLNLPRGGVPVPAPAASSVGPNAVDGPDEHDLFAAVRRLIAGPKAAGVSPYLLAGAPIHTALVRSSEDKDRAVEQIIAFAESMDLGGEKLRKVELCAEELLLNALYDAPCDARGTPRNAALDRRLAVTLGAGETISLTFGCDGHTLAVSVADPFGSLDRDAVTSRLRRVSAGVPRPVPGVAGAGLGLVMTYTVANQLIFSIEPGTLTEATAVLHVSGSNRAAQERGTAVHFYFGRAQAGRA